MNFEKAFSEQRPLKTLEKVQTFERTISFTLRKVFSPVYLYVFEELLVDGTGVPLIQFAVRSEVNGMR